MLGKEGGRIVFWKDMWLIKAVVKEVSPDHMAFVNGEGAE